MTTESEFHDFHKQNVFKWLEETTMIPSLVLIVFEIYALDAEHKNNKYIHWSAVDKH